jgi:hypothetical protein
MNFNNFCSCSTEQEKKNLQNTFLSLVSQHLADDCGKSMRDVWRYLYPYPAVKDCYLCYAIIKGGVILIVLIFRNPLRSIRTDRTCHSRNLLQGTLEMFQFARPPVRNGHGEPNQPVWIGGGRDSRIA